MCQPLSKSPSQLKAAFSSLQTFQDVADILEVDVGQLKYYLYVKPSNNYLTFSIPKKNGGLREITAPSSPIKCIQRKLAQVLDAVYQPKAPAHGFVQAKGIVTNAKMHTQKRYVLNIDLKDFFPSIKFLRVRSKLMVVPYELSATTATIISQICCYQGSLPQGAPTSPVISNIVCAKMDSQLRKFAVKHRCVYTRYADDITFSTSLSKFPSEIAFLEPTAQGIELTISDELNMIIRSNGFEINKDKSRLQPNHQRQEVTGLTVNSKKPNVNRKYLRRIRAILHDWNENGPYAAEQRYWQTNSEHKNPFKGKPDFAQVIRGKIDFIGLVRGKDNPYYLSFLKQLAILSPKSVNKTPFEIELELNHSISIKLQKVIEDLYSPDELMTLCLHLGIKYANLVGNNHSSKSTSLVNDANRLGKLKALDKIVRKERPHAF